MERTSSEMEPPAKRQRFSPPLPRPDFDEYYDVSDEKHIHSASGHGQEDEEDDEEGESLEPEFDLAQRRSQLDNKLKSQFESIFERYGRDFSGVGDEIDLKTGKIVVDNGHLVEMQNERDIGILRDNVSETEDEEFGDENEEVYEDEEDADEEETSGSIDESSDDVDSQDFIEDSEMDHRYNSCSDSENPAPGFTSIRTLNHLQHQNDTIPSNSAALPSETEILTQFGPQLGPEIIKYIGQKGEYRALDDSIVEPAWRTPGLPVTTPPKRPLLKSLLLQPDSDRSPSPEGSGSVWGVAKKGRTSRSREHTRQIRFSNITNDSETGPSMANLNAQISRRQSGESKTSNPAVLRNPSSLKTHANKPEFSESDKDLIIEWVTWTQKQGYALWGNHWALLEEKAPHHKASTYMRFYHKSLFPEGIINASVNDTNSTETGSQMNLNDLSIKNPPLESVPQLFLPPTIQKVKEVNRPTPSEDLGNIVFGNPHTSNSHSAPNVSEQEEAYTHRPPRNFFTEEDDALIVDWYLNFYKENRRGVWKVLSDMLPHRTNESLKSRVKFLTEIGLIDPSKKPTDPKPLTVLMRRSQIWTKEEDAIIIGCVENSLQEGISIHTTRLWSEVAASLPGRTLESFHYRMKNLRKRGGIDPDLSIASSVKMVDKSTPLRIASVTQSSLNLLPTTNHPEHQTTPPERLAMHLPSDSQSTNANEELQGRPKSFSGARLPPLPNNIPERSLKSVSSKMLSVRVVQTPQTSSKLFPDAGLLPNNAPQRTTKHMLSNSRSSRVSQAPKRDPNMISWSEAIEIIEATDPQLHATIIDDVECSTTNQDSDHTRGKGQAENSTATVNQTRGALQPHNAKVTCSPRSDCDKTLQFTAKDNNLIYDWAVQSSQRGQSLSEENPGKGLAETIPRQSGKSYMESRFNKQNKTSVIDLSYESTQSKGDIGIARLTTDTRQTGRLNSSSLNANSHINSNDLRTTPRITDAKLERSPRRPYETLNYIQPRPHIGQANSLTMTSSIPDSEADFGSPESSPRPSRESYLFGYVADVTPDVEDDEGKPISSAVKLMPSTIKGNTANKTLQRTLTSSPFVTALDTGAKTSESDTICIPPILTPQKPRSLSSLQIVNPQSLTSQSTRSPSNAVDRSHGSNEIGKVRLSTSENIQPSNVATQDDYLTVQEASTRILVRGDTQKGIRTCADCGTFEVSQWRKGGDGLIRCSRCGLRWIREHSKEKAEPESQRNLVGDSIQSSVAHVKRQSSIADIKWQSPVAHIRRRRKAISCEACRRHKSKCDRKYPCCSRCEKKENLGICNYSTKPVIIATAPATSVPSLPTPASLNSNFLLISQASKARNGDKFISSIETSNSIKSSCHTVSSTQKTKANSARSMHSARQGGSPRPHNFPPSPQSTRPAIDFQSQSYPESSRKVIPEHAESSLAVSTINRPKNTSRLSNTNSAKSSRATLSLLSRSVMSLVEDDDEDELSFVNDHYSRQPSAAFRRTPSSQVMPGSRTTTAPRVTRDPKTEKSKCSFSRLFDEVRNSPKRPPPPTSPARRKNMMQYANSVSEAVDGGEIRNVKGLGEET